jgi:hypothetical protein
MATAQAALNTGPIVVDVVTAGMQFSPAMAGLCTS